MHPSKVVFAIATVVLIAYLVFLWTTGLSTAEHWLLLLVPPFVVLIAYVWTARGTAALKEPLSVRKIARKYFVEEGWWVVMWLLLIFGFGYFAD